MFSEKYTKEFAANSKGSSIFNKLIRLGLYCPPWRLSYFFFSKFQACQLKSNKIHISAVKLNSLSMPWPFHTQDFYRFIILLSQGNIWS